MTRPALSVLARSRVDVPDDLTRLLSGGLLPGSQPPRRESPQAGLDFASQNALGLSLPIVQGSSGAAARALEHRIAATLCLPAARTFASAAEATRATMASLLQPGDQVLVDASADSAMLETVLGTQATPHRFPSGSLDAVERRLQRLSRQPQRGRLVIAVPAVSAHGARIADLAALSDLARHHGATLVVDVAQDFGAMAPNGGGVLELQTCLDRVDVVIGSFTRCFGMEGGFAAFRDPALAQAAHRAAPLPAPAAQAILAAAEIVFSPLGTRLRRNLMGLSQRLRNHLMADGLRVLGSAAPFVPVLLPPLTALPRTALLESCGPRVTLLMPPIVPAQAPRWRIELSARHTLAEIDDLAELIRDVSRAFDRQPRLMPVSA
jgi:7-keto-8-aminopelargonate synthetase-like enzyme